MSDILAITNGISISKHTKKTKKKERNRIGGCFVLLSIGSRPEKTKLFIILTFQW